MLKVLRGYEVKTYNLIKNLKIVKEAYCIVGEYSIFVVVQADNTFILYRIIDSLKNILGVTSIWHILGFERQQPILTEKCAPRDKYIIKI